MNRIAEKYGLPGKSGMICLALIIGWLAGIVFLGADMAAAQGKGAKKNPEERVAELKERLNLTDEQVAAIRPVIEQHETQRKEIWSRKKGEMEQLHQSTQSRIAGILSEEQLAEYGKICEEKGEKMREKGERRMDRRQGAEY